MLSELWIGISQMFDMALGKRVFTMGGYKTPTGLMWVLLLSYGIFFLASVLVQVDSRDVWWHLHIGKEIAETHAVPTTDRFTLLGEGRPYLDSHWLFQVFLNGVTELVGTNGISIYQVIVFGLLFSSFFFLPGWRQQTPSVLMMTVFIASIGICAVSPRFLPRPEALTYLFIALFILLFEHYRINGTKLIFLVPLMMIIWVNSHALFVIGHFIIGAYLIESVLTRLSPDRFQGNPDPLPAILVLALSLAVIFMNPYGARLLEYSYLLATEVGKEAHPLMKSLAELTPTFSGKNIRSFAFPFYVLLFFMSFLSLLIRAGRTPLSHFLLLTVFFILSLTGSRNMALFASAAVPITITSITDARWEFRPGILRVAIIAVISLLFFQSIMFVTNRHYHAEGVRRRFGIGVLEESYPAGAVRFIKVNKPAPNLGHFDPHGGYYMYALSSLSYRPLFDGRWEVYDQDQIYELFSALSTPSLFLHLMDRYGVNLYVVDHTREMNRKILLHLYRSPAWAFLYFDHRSALFARDIPRNRGLVENTRVHLPSAVASLKFTREDVERQIPQAIMNLMIYLDEQDPGMIVAGKILDLNPEEEQTSQILVDYLVQRGRLSEAMDRIEEALAAGAENAHLLSQKSYILFAFNDIKGAIDEMQKAVKLSSDHAGYYYNLALLYVKDENPGRAEQYARRVEALEPEYPGLVFLLQEIQGGRPVSQKKR